MNSKRFRQLKDQPTWNYHIYFSKTGSEPKCGSVVHNKNIESPEANLVLPDRAMIG